MSGGRSTSIFSAFSGQPDDSGLLRSLVHVLVHRLLGSSLLLEHGLACCVASDAHNPLQRNTHMAEVSAYLREEYGEYYQRLLLEEDPARILSGRELLGYRPIPFW